MGALHVVAVQMSLSTIATQAVLAIVLYLHASNILVSCELHSNNISNVVFRMIERVTHTRTHIANIVRMRLSLRVLSRFQQTFTCGTAVVS